MCIVQCFLDFAVSADLWAEMFLQPKYSV